MCFGQYVATVTFDSHALKECMGCWVAQQYDWDVSEESDAPVTEESSDVWEETSDQTEAVEEEAEEANEEL